MRMRLLRRMLSGERVVAEPPALHPMAVHEAGRAMLCWKLSLRPLVAVYTDFTNGVHHCLRLAPRPDNPQLAPLPHIRFWTGSAEKVALRLWEGGHPGMREVCVALASAAADEAMFFKEPLLCDVLFAKAPAPPEYENDMVLANMYARALAEDIVRWKRDPAVLREQTNSWQVSLSARSDELARAILVVSMREAVEALEDERDELIELSKVHRLLLPPFRRHSSRPKCST
jgi:hypothetical protein